MTAPTPDPVALLVKEARVVAQTVRETTDCEIDHRYVADKLDEVAAALQSSEARREAFQRMMVALRNEARGDPWQYSSRDGYIEPEGNKLFGEAVDALAALQSRLAAAGADSAKAMRERFEAKWGRIRSLACEQITTEGNLRLSRLDGEELWAFAAPPSAPGGEREGV